jgi:hypothetical protein
MFATGLASSTYTSGITVNFGVVMRTEPTITVFSTHTGTSGKIYDANANTDITPVIANISDDNFFLDGTTASAQAGYNFQWQWIATAEIVI